MNKHHGDKKLVKSILVKTTNIDWIIFKHIQHMATSNKEYVNKANKACT
jgi:hypothetical protein